MNPDNYIELSFYIHKKSETVQVSQAVYLAALSTFEYSYYFFFKTWVIALTK